MTVGGRFGPVAGEVDSRGDQAFASVGDRNYIGRARSWAKVGFMPGVRVHSGLALLEFYLFRCDRIVFAILLSVAVSPFVVDVHHKAIFGSKRSEVPILSTLEHPLQRPQKVIDHLETR